MIKFKKPDVVEDTLVPQIRKAMNAIDKMMAEEGFKVLRKNFWYDENFVFMLFEMEIWLVPKIAKNIGPNVYSKHAENFLKYYKEYKVFIEGEEWTVEKERDFVTVLHLLKNLLSKNEKIMLEKGIPSKIAPELKDSVLYAGGEVLKETSNLPKEFRIFMREWFEKDLNVA